MPGALAKQDDRGPPAHSAAAEHSPVHAAPAAEPRAEPTPPPPPAPPPPGPEPKHEPPAAPAPERHAEHAAANSERIEAKAERSEDAARATKAERVESREERRAAEPVRDARESVAAGSASTEVRPDPPRGRPEVRPVVHDEPARERRPEHAATPPPVVDRVEPTPTDADEGARAPARDDLPRTQSPAAAAGATPAPIALAAVVIPASAPAAAPSPAPAPVAFASSTSLQPTSASTPSTGSPASASSSSAAMAPARTASGPETGDMQALRGGRRRTRAVWLLTKLFGFLGWKRVHQKNALGHRVRRQLLDHLRLAPGDHLRGIARALDLTAQNAQYHLRQMAALGFVSSQSVNGKTCWFPLEGGRPVKERALANSLLMDQARQRILAALREMPGLHQGELARRLGLASGSVNWHVGQLVEAGLLEEGRDGNRVRYVPTKNALALDSSPLPPPTPAPAASSN